LGEQYRDPRKSIGINFLLAERFTDFFLLLFGSGKNILTSWDYNTVHAFNSYGGRVADIFQNNDAPKLPLSIFFKSEIAAYAYINGYPRTFRRFKLLLSSFPLIATDYGVRNNCNQCEELYKQPVPWIPLFALFFSFPFLWWSLGWGKGVYNYPKGLRGFILAVGALGLGIVLCAYGFNGLLIWWGTQF